MKPLILKVIKNQYQCNSIILRSTQGEAMISLTQGTHEQCMWFENKQPQLNFNPK